MKVKGILKNVNLNRSKYSPRQTENSRENEGQPFKESNTESKGSPEISYRNKFLITSTKSNRQSPNGREIREIKEDNYKKFKIEVDTSKLYDELMKIKIEMHKKVKEVNFYKVENKKLEEENKRVYKLVEYILRDSGVSMNDLMIRNEGGENKENNYNFQEKSEKFEKNENSQKLPILSKTVHNVNFLSLTKVNPDIGSKEMLENKIADILTNEFNDQEVNPLKVMFNTPKNQPVNKLEYNHKNILKLQETYILNQLKHQIISLRSELSRKNEEILELKNNIKYISYQLVENKLKMKEQEVFLLQKDNENLAKNLDEQERNFQGTFEEKENYKSRYFSLKERFEEMNVSFKKLQEENLKLSEANKNVEEKLKNSKYYISATKKEVRDKEKEISDLKEIINREKGIKVK